MAKNETLSSKIKVLVEKSEGLTRTWELNNVKWHKMRMRIKKAKNFPFQGCANLRLPIIDTKIKKLKAALNNIVFGIRPIVQVIPSPGGTWEGAYKIERFLDHMLMDVMKIKEKIIIGIDQMLEKGFYLLKPYWKIHIIKRVEKLSIRDLPIEEALPLITGEFDDMMLMKEIAKRYEVDSSDLVAKENGMELQRIVDAIRAGEENIDVTFQDVICNYPDIALCQPESVYVPTDAGVNVNDPAWIVHEYIMSLEDLKAGAEMKGWDIEGVGDILKYADVNSIQSSSSDKLIDVEKDLREGISGVQEEGRVKIWEFYGSMDINNDGESEECIITLAPDFNKVMRKMANPFHLGTRPFVKLFYELTDDRWFSHRGVPELIEDFVKEIDMQHNQKIDQQTIRNTPMFIHRAGMINKNMMQFVFGQSIAVNGMQPLSDIIAPLNNTNTNAEFSYEREQMLLETKIEELIGQVDFSLQSMINKRQPRTLGEVNLQQQNMQQVFSLDADLLRNSMEDLFNWVWALWCQYGDEYYEFGYFGQEGYQPIKLTKEELQGKYKITVRGNDQNTNPQLRIDKASMILQAIQNPIAFQSGVITPMNLANAYKRMFQELNIPNWEELVSPPQPPQPPPAEVRINAKDLTDAEMAQVLQQKNIRPDMQGRMIKTVNTAKMDDTDRRSKKVDNYSKIVKAMQSLNEKEEPEEAFS